MLTVAQAWDEIDRVVAPRPPQRRPLDDSLGTRLAEDFVADVDMPAFSRSAVDGFVVRAGQGAGRYRLCGEVRPGRPAAPPPAAGEAMRIFTGTALPDEGVALVRVEDAVVQGEFVEFTAAPGAADIRPAASQARKGQVLLAAGATMTPGAVALAATVGVAQPLVSPRLRAAHVVTGSELVEVSQTPDAGSIRDSNGPLVRALLEEAGVGCVMSHRVAERVDETVSALSAVDADILLVSGGAGPGAHDGTAAAFERLGFEIRFSRVACRPGKPLIFATREQTVAFGLPGNPLSHFVCFHLFVRRAVDALSARPATLLVPARIDGAAPPVDPRETWWPCRIRAVADGLVARIVPWRDSSDLTGLPRANALLRVPPDGIKPLADALVFGMLDA